MRAWNDGGLVSGSWERTVEGNVRRTEDSLGPVGDAFHERVSGHQGQRGRAQEDAAVLKGRRGVIRFEFFVVRLRWWEEWRGSEVWGWGPRAPQGARVEEGEGRGINYAGTHLYQFSCVSTARPAVSCGARNVMA